MDDKLIEALALAAGLEKAWRLFPDEIVGAANRVEQQRAALGDPALVPDGSNAPWTQEPWPPMRVPGR